MGGELVAAYLTPLKGSQCPPPLTMILQHTTQSLYSCELFPAVVCSAPQGSSGHGRGVLSLHSQAVHLEQFSDCLSASFVNYWLTVKLDIGHLHPLWHSAWAMKVGHSG